MKIPISPRRGTPLGNVEPIRFSTAIERSLPDVHEAAVCYKSFNSIAFWVFCPRETIAVGDGRQCGIDANVPCHNTANVRLLKVAVTSGIKKEVT